MDATGVIVVGNPSFHRIPLSEILSSRGLRVVRAGQDGRAAEGMDASGAGVRALFLDLSHPTLQRATPPALPPPARGIVVFGIINPLSSTIDEAMECGCHQALSVFDTPEEVLGKLMHALFGGAEARRNSRVFGYWPASIGAGGPEVPCRAVTLSREGAFLQTEWVPEDPGEPLAASIDAVPGRPLRAVSRVLYQVPCAGRVVLGGVGIRFLEGFGEAESIVEILSTNGRGASSPIVAQARPAMLVADDDPFVRGLLVRVFERQGWEVAGVNDGLQAVEEASKRAFDAVLMDVEMAGLNGVEAMKRIRPILPRARCALMTGGGTRVLGLIREAREAAGPIEVLAKPFDLADLERLFPRPG